MTEILPFAALDDRLAFVGITGSGKTYAACGFVERLLAKRARCVIIDPLDVWWGLRLLGDGKTPSPWPVVIFGGRHGDLPLTENAGALLGETVATMAESCIVSLGGLPTKSAERRFMLAFLDAIYRKTDPVKTEPYHIVFDEADLWAPQRAQEPALQSRMEEIVRRGRVKGFIPWLITQRPAVLSKDVLSQVDGMIALKLTASQDRDAIGAWIEGQADKAEGKRILASLPAMEKGQGVIWIPARGILETVRFPKKSTFDSSRTPKRGERAGTATPAQLDLTALRHKLTSIEEETRANDPRALKAENARLRAEMARAVQQKIVADPAALLEAEERGYARGLDEVQTLGRELLRELIEVGFALTSARSKIEPFQKRLEEWRRPSRPHPASLIQSRGSAHPVIGFPKPQARVKPIPSNGPATAMLPDPLQRIVNAIRYWNVFGLAAPTHQQVAFIASYRAGSGTWNRYLSTLRTDGYIEPRGALTLTELGLRAAHEPEITPSGDGLRNAVMAKIPAPLSKILGLLLAAYPQTREHEEIAEQANYAPGTGTWNRYLSALRSLDLIERRGPLKAQDWLFP